MTIRRIAIAAATLFTLALPASHAETPVPEARPQEVSVPEWRDVDPDNLLLIDTKYGTVAVELAPDFAPAHAARMKALARAHFYDGTAFYRVIDGFVAQGGIGEGTAATGGEQVADDPRRAEWTPLKAEFDAPQKGLPPFVPLGNADLFAPMAGHVLGFPVGRDPGQKREWIIHCPGTFAFARDNDADTATTEFYIVIGQAPRRLDRNLTAFGRVLDGMQYLQKLERGDPKVDSGVIQQKDRADKIISVRVAADLPEAQRPHYQVMNMQSDAFVKWKNERRNPAPGFYKLTPPPILDVCLSPVPVQRVDMK